VKIITFVLDSLLAGEFIVKIIDKSPSLNLDEFMRRPLFAHLATSGADGARESPVWCLWKNEVLWICTDIKKDTYCYRIEKDNRCAIGIVDYDATSGKLHHVGFRGTAKLTPFDITIAKEIFSKYLGKNNQSCWPDWFQQFLNDPNARLICFTPATVVVRDQSYFFASNHLK